MGIAISTHFPPPVMIESTEVRRWVTHMLCWSWAMYFSAAASSENDQGSMNLASNTASESSRHSWNGGVFDPALHIAHPAAGMAFIQGPVEVLGGGPELHTCRRWSLQRTTRPNAAPRISTPVLF